jgi:hypothetical protein
LVDCILSGNYLPEEGSEKWQIFRNETTSTMHTMIYESASACENSASLILQDGRTIVFKQ